MNIFLSRREEEALRLIYDKKDEEAYRILREWIIEKDEEGSICCNKNGHPLYNAESRYAVEGLDEKRFIKLDPTCSDPIGFLRIPSKGRYYFENKEKIMRNQFVELHGKEKEIVEIIHDKPNEEALRLLSGKYTLGDIETELFELRTECYIDFHVDTDGILSGLKILQRCKNYFEMERYFMQRNGSIYIDISGDSNVIAAGNTGDVSQNVNYTQTQNEALSLIGEMKKLAESIEDSETRGDVIGCLDDIEEQIKSPAPNKAKFDRFIKFIEMTLEPIKHITPATTLLVHLNTLVPLVVSLFGG